MPDFICIWFWESGQLHTLIASCRNPGFSKLENGLIKTQKCFPFCAFFSNQDKVLHRKMFKKCETHWQWWENVWHIHTHHAFVALVFCGSNSKVLSPAVYHCSTSLRTECWVRWSKRPVQLVILTTVVDACFSTIFRVLCRVLTYVYLYSYNVWLLLCPAVLSYDYQMGAVPLIHTLCDTRNISSASLILTASLLFYATFFRLKVWFPSWNYLCWKKINAHCSWNDRWSRSISFTVSCPKRSGLESTRNKVFVPRYHYDRSGERRRLLRREMCRGASCWVSSCSSCPSCPRPISSSLSVSSWQNAFSTYRGMRARDDSGFVN